MAIPSIQPAELAQRLAAGNVTLIDVRSPAEFAASHVSGARNVPLDQLVPAVLAALPRSGPLHVICQSGMRSRAACEQLAAAGISDVVDIAGGTSACTAAGLTLSGSGGAAFGVERQVRCIIGGGVLAGVVLALCVHPYWVALSGFFGAGLFVAGLTNLCPLALLVARMPWNRAKPAGGACCVSRSS